MVAWGTNHLSKMGDAVWSGVMLVVLACVVSCSHATVPTYLISRNKKRSHGIYARTICTDLVHTYGPNCWLAMLRTSDQVSAFEKLLTQRQIHLSDWIWIGLYRKRNSADDQFYWVNNDTEPLGLKPTLAVDWYPGQPDNSGGEENCVVVRPAGSSGSSHWELDDLQCSTGPFSGRPWACQIPDESPPSMSVTADLVDDGGQVNLTCIWNASIFHDPHVIYTYRKEGSAADILERNSSSASDTLTLIPVNVSDTGRYWCTVGGSVHIYTQITSDYFTLSTSNSIALRVTPKTPTFSLDPPVPVTGVYDDTQVTFLCASDSATAVKIVPTFHFIRDGIIIKSTNLTYRKNMTTSDIGNYSCKVSMNGVDSAVSNSIAVEASTTTDEPTTTATPATTKTPGLSPEMKVLVAIQLTGFAAGLFGLLGMCVPVVYVCLRRACCKGDKEEKEGDDEDDEEDEDEKYLNGDDEHVRKVRWESEEEEEETESESESTVSSIVSHAEKAVSAVWSAVSGGMVPGGLMPGGVHGVIRRGSGVDLTSKDEGRSPDTTPTSASESPRGSVVSRLFGSDLLVHRLSGSEVFRKQ